jgi:MoaA/NifB/PqqE/SkfB family radical SAM enzyme
MPMTNTLTAGMERARELAAELALDQALKYLNRNPDENLPRILDFVERLAPDEGQKKNIRVLKKRLADDERAFAQIKRLASNQKMLKNFMNIWVIKAIVLGGPHRNALMKRYNVHIPCAILVDPTSACNLRCRGCWAGKYQQMDRLEPELLNRILREAKDLGIYWIVFSGGEPFAYPELLDVVAEHPDLAFMAYTNGTLIYDKVADRLAELANFTPAISLEGWREETDARRGEGVFDKIVATMDRLRERGVFFGASVTVTRQNIDTIFSDEFIDFLVDKGAVYAWSFHYIPVGRGPNLDMMITPEQRAWLVERVAQIRNTKPILIADFWNDGHFTGGCIAGGKMYLHINAAGDVEPCAFAHFASDNIHDKSLLEVLSSPLFKAYQARQPFYKKSAYAPCPIIDVPQALRDIVAESGARPTHSGAEDVLTGTSAAFLDRRSAQWRQVADTLEERYYGTAIKNVGK